MRLTLKDRKLTKAQQEVLELLRENPATAAGSLAIKRYEARPEAAKTPFYRLEGAQRRPLVQGTERTLRALWLLGLVEPCGIGYDGQQYRVSEVKQ